MKTSPVISHEKAGSDMRAALTAAATARRAKASFYLGCRFRKTPFDSRAILGADQLNADWPTSEPLRRMTGRHDRALFLISTRFGPWVSRLASVVKATPEAG